MGRKKIARGKIVPVISITLGILIICFPALVIYGVGFYLIISGVLELLD